MKEKTSREHVQACAHQLVWSKHKYDLDRSWLESPIMLTNYGLNMHGAGGCSAGDVLSEHVWTISTSSMILCTSMVLGLKIADHHTIDSNANAISMMLNQKLQENQTQRHSRKIENNNKVPHMFEQKTNHIEPILIKTTSWSLDQTNSPTDLL